MRTRKTALLLALAPLLAGSTPLEVSLYSPAKTSFPTLAVPLGVRAVGMGEAYGAAGNDLYALHWNPAGLARLSGYQAGLAHNEWFPALGLRQEFLSYGQSLGRSRAFAVSASYFNFGALEERSEAGALTGESPAYAFAGTAGAGWGLLEQGKLKLGFSLEFAAESLFGALESGVGASAGMIYELSPFTSAAASLSHLGAGAGGFMPPLGADIGVSHRLLDGRFTLAADLGLPLNAAARLRGGMEFLLGALALRGGWRQALNAGPGDLQSGPSAGLGFTLGLFTLDYAFAPYGWLSSTHRFSATMALPSGIFSPLPYDPGHSTATAKALYEAALAGDRGGALMESMIDYERAVEAYPLERFKQAPHDFYLASKRRIMELRTKMSESGQSEGARAQISKNLAEGQAFLLAQKYKAAIGSAGAVLTLDFANAQAIKLKKDAEGAMSLRKDFLGAEARAADSAGDLSQAIRLRREILRIDPADAQSRAFFAVNKARINELLKRIHRAGIDAYVAGRLEDAVSLWEGGIRLEPSDPLNLGRDIEKARKLMNMRESK